jgi:uncharacterized protein DUF4258
VTSPGYPAPYEKKGIVKIRYYIDPETELPHIYRHNVSEQDVEEVLRRPGEDRLGREGSRVAIGCTSDGRYLRVIYVPDPEPDSVFVITAYDLHGKSLAAYRRRHRRKRK